MPRTKLPKAERAIIAAHEAGMHDRKPTPETCRPCAAEAQPKPEPKPARAPRPTKKVPAPAAPPPAAEASDPGVEVPPPASTPDALPHESFCVDPTGDHDECPAPPGALEADTTREEWMQTGVGVMRAWFPEDVTVPEVHVSIGWPGGRGSKKNVVGQCWVPETVADGLPAIFVSPVHKDPWEVLETLLHEMVHAAGFRGHRGPFARVAGSVGFVAPWTSTPSSPELKQRLIDLAEKLGPFPHARVNGTSILGLGTGPAVQSTRMIKVQCAACGYTLRTTRKWLDVAIPSCPVDGDEMAVEL